MPAARDLFNQLTAAKAALVQAQGAVPALTTAEDNARTAAQHNPGDVALKQAADAARIAATEAKLEASQAELKVKRLESEVDALDEGARPSVKEVVAQALTSSSTWMLLGTALLVWAIMNAVTNGSSALGHFLDGDGQTRGLLTFLLGISTIGIAFTLVYQAFQPGVTPEGFRFSREVFGSLVAVLGTIVGFYFGAAKNEESTPELKAGAAAIRVLDRKVEADKLQAAAKEARAAATQARAAVEKAAAADKAAAEKTAVDKENAAKEAESQAETARKEALKSAEDAKAAAEKAQKEKERKG